MVANPRKTAGAGPLRAVGINYRAVGLPTPVVVEEDEWQGPMSIFQRGRTLRAVSIDDVWQVDDEWWRENPISRRYYQVTTEDDRRITIFRDQVNGGWYVH